MSDANATINFEAGIAELDALVRRLDGGELSLEEALAAFEAGVGLVRTLSERLNQAEARVESLTKTASGELERRALEIDDSPA